METTQTAPVLLIYLRVFIYILFQSINLNACYVNITRAPFTFIYLVGVIFYFSQMFLYLFNILSTFLFPYIWEAQVQPPFLPTSFAWYEIHRGLTVLQEWRMWTITNFIWENLLSECAVRGNRSLDQRCY